MRFEELVVAKEDDPKGRTFIVHRVASIEAEGVVPAAGNATRRPVLLAYAGTPSAVRAFTVNLRSGLVAATREEKVELLRSLGYRYQVTQAGPGRALVVAYLPELFHLQPGVVGDDAVRFVSAPPVWWLDRQEALLRPEVGERAREHARAMAFVARLDARTPLPIANDPRFHHALFERMVEKAWVATDEERGLRCRGVEALGLEAPVLCDTTQGVLAEFLAEATAELLEPEPVARVSPVVAAMPAFPRQLALAF